ncbi:MAG: DEAD/DEAH box helicase [Kofleriaceae bacterium]
MELRPYQLEQVESVERYHHIHQVRSVLVEAATGTGKTTSSAELARRAVPRGETVLFLAHRRELIDQAAARFQSFGLLVGIERGSSRAGAEPVVCASVQTMRGPRLWKFPHDAFDVIIVDEAHHAAAPSYQAIFDHFPNARIVGVTATTDRADGIPLRTVFSHVAHRYGIAEAIHDGYLTPIRGIQVTVPGLDLSKVRLRRQVKRGRGVDPTADIHNETTDILAPAGQARVSPDGERYSIDLHPGDLGRAAIAPEAVEGIVVPLLELAEARRTIVFAVNVRHAAAIAESICVKRGRGVARIVHHRMKARERKAVQAAHRAGEFQFLVNVMLLTEGYDDPAIACVAMARPTQSRVLYSQAVGRALRLFAGKEFALLLDFVGVGAKFDLVGPEDALGAALAGPIERVGAAPADKVEQENRPRVRRVEEVVSAPSRALAAIIAVESGRAVRVRFTTKVIELVRGRARAVGGWFARAFGRR